MKKTITIDFPDDFVFPEHFSEEICEKCPCVMFDTYDPIADCGISRMHITHENEKCPFWEC